MTNTLIFIWSIVVLLGLSSITALIWAVTTGQLSEFHEGATSIFDDDEPVGEVTDSFPMSEIHNRSHDGQQQEMEAARRR